MSKIKWDVVKDRTGRNWLSFETRLIYISVYPGKAGRWVVSISSGGADDAVSLLHATDLASEDEAKIFAIEEYAKIVREEAVLAGLL